ncbi:MAG: hypothetical protein RLO12_03215 [Fulvivirga sp.]
MNKVFYFLLSLLVLTGCDISDNDAVDPSEGFFKIYDNNLFDASFIPIDIKQTTDGGYLILSSKRIETSNFTGVNLIKVDKEGNFIEEQIIDEQYVGPVDQLVKITDSYYFMAMDATSLQAILFTVNDSSRITAINPTGLSYPMYMAEDGENILALSYNNGDKNSIISRISTTGQTLQSAAYGIGAGSDTEAPIITHFTRTGRQLPFFAGRMNGGVYYFNGFYNYTMSLVFTNFGDEPLGVVQGQQDDGGFSSGMSISGGNFALSRFNFGDNFIIPSIDLNTTGTTSATDFEGNAFPELSDNALVVLDLINIDGQEAILYGSNTKSGQIILMAYSKTSGELLGTRYLGSTYPYQIADFTVTEDMGLAVVGNTSVAGRFDRICLFKLSKEELTYLIN